jgi:hypothetical protein
MFLWTHIFIDDSQNKSCQKEKEEVVVVEEEEIILTRFRMKLQELSVAAQNLVVF